MKKPDVKKDNVDPIFYQLLDLTNEAKNSILVKDIDNLEKFVYIRQELINKIQDMFKNREFLSSELEILNKIQKETDNLIKMVENSKDEVFNTLVSLYNAKKVIKYY